MASNRGRTLASLQGAQQRLASPTFGQASPLVRTLNSLSNPQHQAGPNLLAQRAPVAGVGQASIMPVGLHPAATSLGHTDQYNVTTRLGTATPGPSMGNQGAIDAAYAARNANHVMPKFGTTGTQTTAGSSIRDHEGSRTLDDLFPSTGDAGRRETFEAAKLGREAQKDQARKMRTQRAQWRNAIGYNSPAMGGGWAGRRSPIFDEAGNLDQLASLAANQSRVNPALSLATLETQQRLGQGDRRLDQLATKAEFENEMAGKRFGLDELVQKAGVDNSTRSLDSLLQSRTAEQANEGRRLSELEAQGEYNRGQTYRDHQLRMTGQEASRPAMTPAESFQASQGFGAQAPANQTRAVEWGGGQIRQDPSRANEISQMVGASDDDLIDEYTNAFESPNWFWESDTDGAKQKARIESIGLMLDARGIPRPELDRKLPWAQEFAGFSYANPQNTGRTLDDLLSK